MTPITTRELLKFYAFSLAYLGAWGLIIDGLGRKVLGG